MTIRRYFFFAAPAACLFAIACFFWLLEAFAFDAFCEDFLEFAFGDLSPMRFVRLELVRQSTRDALKAKATLCPSLCL
jgi:hypothetical protein